MVNAVVNFASDEQKALRERHTVGVGVKRWNVTFLNSLLVGLVLLQQLVHPFRVKEGEQDFVEPRVSLLLQD